MTTLADLNPEQITLPAGWCVKEDYCVGVSMYDETDTIISQHPKDSAVWRVSAIQTYFERVLKNDSGRVKVPGKVNGGGLVVEHCDHLSITSSVTHVIKLGDMRYLKLCHACWDRLCVQVMKEIFHG
jgi:homospermidine synthase